MAPRGGPSRARNEATAPRFTSARITEIAMPLVVLALLALLVAACGPEDRQSAALNDSPRCEVRPNAGGCRASVPRPDDGWRTSGFGGY